MKLQLLSKEKWWARSVRRGKHASHDHFWDLLEIAMLACCCAVHKHCLDVLFSFSEMVRSTPNPPIGFSILKAGLYKSVLLSIYSSSTTRDCNDDRSHDPS